MCWLTSTLTSPCTTETGPSLQRASWPQTLWSSKRRRRPLYWPPFQTHMRCHSVEEYMELDVPCENSRRLSPMQFAGYRWPSRIEAHHENRDEELWRAAGGTSVVGDRASPERERGGNWRHPVQIATIGTKVSKYYSLAPRNFLLIACKVTCVLNS